MRKNLVFGCILVISLLFVTPSISAIQWEIVNNEIDNNGHVNKEKQYLSIFNRGKYNFKWRIAQLYVLVRVIELVIKNQTEFKNYCDETIIKLIVLFRKWPAFMCFTLLRIYWLIDEIAYYLIYDLGFPILGEILENRLKLLNFIFVIRCNWMYPYYTNMNYSVLAKSKDIPCPCMIEENNILR